jgi:GDP-L-fucose synthase
LTIKEAVGFSGDIVWDNSFSDGQIQKTANTKKLMGLIGDFKFTPFRIGNF